MNQSFANLTRNINCKFKRELLCTDCTQVQYNLMKPVYKTLASSAGLNLPEVLTE